MNKLSNKNKCYDKVKNIYIYIYIQTHDIRIFTCK